MRRPLLVVAATECPDLGVALAQRLAEVGVRAATLPVMESLARAERLREFQARNAERAAAAGQDYESLLAEIRRTYPPDVQGRDAGAVSVPGPAALSVVFDVNVLVLAVAVGEESPFRSWPSPPPTSGNPSADCLGVVNDAAEFELTRRFALTVAAMVTQGLATAARLWVIPGLRLPLAGFGTGQRSCGGGFRCVSPLCGGRDAAVRRSLC